MKVLVTGANGFVGSLLAQRLQSDPNALGEPVSELMLADMAFSEVANAPSAGPPVSRRTGSIADPAYLAGLVAESPDVVFHLASIPGGAAERDPALGTAVNLHAATSLLEQLAAHKSRGQARPPVVVFTSTVAVYGAQLPTRVDADTPLRPAMSYGAHKLMSEYHLADLSRRGLIDGRAVRLPGIVARPPQGSGLVSAFMSDIIHRLAAGEAFTCPVSPGATAWWMSVGRCVDNLLHAARITPEQLAAQAGSAQVPARVWPLPVLRFSMAELVEALARLYGNGDAARVRALVRYEPIEGVEALFGRYPPMASSEARSLGFVDDGDIDTLIRRALQSA